MLFVRLLPNKGSRITQSQFKAKRKCIFATWLHILIEQQNMVLIYRAGRTAYLPVQMAAASVSLKFWDADVNGIEHIILADTKW